MPQDLRIAIAQARNAKGWTQEQFAHYMCIPKVDINSWENGKAVPTGLQIAKMDKVLGVKLPRPNKH
jgi:ribosome-binding protein aMBF1 (putative translation factor)